MGNIDKIYEYVEESTMILIINNNSKLLLDTLVNFIYNKSSLKKYEYTKTKGLLEKVQKQKEKIIRIDLDLNKIRFTSSNNPKKLNSEFVILQSIIVENKSKILFKTDLSTYKEYVDPKNIEQSIVAYDVFDLIILIDKTDIKMLQRPIYESYRDYRPEKERKKYSIEQLLRRVKLRQIQDRLKKYENNL